VNHRHRTTAAVLAVPVLSLGLSSCGFNAPTDRIYNPPVGVNEQDGTVDVLNALVVSGSDGSGTLAVGLANNDQAEDDALAGVTGERVQVQVGGETTIPAGGFLNLSDGSLSVTGDQVTPGAFVRLTFTFDRAASVTLRAPVVEAEGDYADVPLP
jgi:hypothetical protein